MTASPNVYQIITDQILAKLQAGTCPWKKSWSESKASGGTRPMNLDHRCYHGTNWFLLSMLGFDRPIFGTFKQIQAHGGQVIKGSKGFPVIFWKQMKTTDEKTGEEKTIPMLRYYTVFNVAQCEGLELAPIPTAEPVDQFQAIADAEAIWTNYQGKPGLIHSGSQPCYIPALDQIRMPIQTAFDSPADYYSTLFHEAGHSTGHTSRLNREFGAKFGSELYSREELVAELTAAFLGAECGLDATLDQAAAYIKSWLRFLESDPKAFVLAAGKAQRAADHILGKAKEAEKENDAAA